MSGYSTGVKGTNGYRKTRGSSRVHAESMISKYPSTAPVARSDLVSVWDSIPDFS